MDKSDLVEKIIRGTADFRVKISEIRNSGGSEVLTSISEDFGVGLSIVIAEELFKLKSSTIQRIYGTKKRPDWKAQTENNRILVVESKGASSQSTSNNQESNAIIQKGEEQGDIKVASLSVIREDQLSTNRFLDPPIENSNMSPEMENHILRAGHYASVFSFLGSSKLSKYFSRMRKRLKGLISPFEQSLKESTFRELTYQAPVVQFNNSRFAGSFVKLDEGKYLFVGVDKRLISYQGFINFSDFENDIDDTQDGNHYLRFKDGILIIEISRIEKFSEIITPEQIPNYQDNVTISDVDGMNELSFRKFIIYLLERFHFEDIREEPQMGDFRFDISAKRNDMNYFFELKLFKKKEIPIESIPQFLKTENLPESGKFIFITNAQLEEYPPGNENHLTIIDRSKLVLLFKRKEFFLEII